jgi:hypothetical protein
MKSIESEFEIGQWYKSSYQQYDRYSIVLYFKLSKIINNSELQTKEHVRSNGTHTLLKRLSFTDFVHNNPRKVSEEDVKAFVLSKGKIWLHTKNMENTIYEIY